MAFWVPMAISLGTALLSGKKRQPQQFAPYQPYVPQQTRGFDEDEYLRRLMAAKSLLNTPGPGGYL